jgi:hypothetical protein
MSASSAEADPAGDLANALCRVAEALQVIGEDSDGADGPTASAAEPVEPAFPPAPEQVPSGSGPRGPNDAALGQFVGENELWIVSTRHLPDGKCGCAPEFNPCVNRYECGAGWIGSSLDEFLASDDGSRATVVFVHGNDNEASDAVQVARQLYCQLTEGPCAAGPVRLVIWSWPSQRVVRGFRPDAQVKSCRTNVEGYYFGSFLDRIPSGSPVSVAGYSFGARIVTGGLHMLGGGAISGYQLTDRENPQRQVTSALLMGAAMANNWLLPGMPHGQAISQVERLVVLYNPNDRVLHWYPHLWGRGGPEALGATGVAAPARLGEDRVKLVQVNVQPQMHRRHSWKYFSSSPAIMSLVRREFVILPESEIVAR